MTSSFPTLCGSIAGSPSTLGVAMHNAAYEAVGIDFTYVAFGIESTEDAISAMRMLGIRGLGVSMPHKVEVIKHLDEIDETAQKIGAVNTIVNTNGILKGFNTDWIGAVRAIQEETVIAGKNIVVVGAGGAARAVTYGLVREHSQVTIYNRTTAKGERLAQEFGVRFGGGLEELTSISDYDILINATSVGFNAPEKSIIPETILRPGKVVLDVVFLPPATKFIHTANSYGCRTISGIRMLIHQALFQFELYTGRRAPFEAMETALLKRIQLL